MIRLAPHTPACPSPPRERRRRRDGPPRRCRSRLRARRRRRFAPSTASRCPWSAARSPRSWAREGPASRRCCSSPPAGPAEPGPVPLGETEARRPRRTGARTPAPRADRVRLPFLQPPRRPRGRAGTFALPARLAGTRLPRSAAGDGSVPASVWRSARGHPPAQLSGGQQQRVAIERALVGRANVRVPPTSPRRARHALGRGVLALLHATIDETGARWSWSPTTRPSRVGRPVPVHGRRRFAGELPRPERRGWGPWPEGKHEMLRISLQTLRARRGTLAGAFVAIWLHAVTLACATGLLMAGALGAPGGAPQRGRRRVVRR